jgi:hypothetical protein
MSLHEHDAEKLKFDLMLGIVISQLILVLRYTPDYSTTTCITSFQFHQKKAIQKKRDLES